MRKLGLVLLTAAVASVTFVHGYVVDPQGLRWFGARAVFHSYFDTADAQRAVAEAVRGWQGPLEDAVELQAVGGRGAAAIGNSVSEIGWESLPPEVVSLTTLWLGLIKAPVFAVVIALIGCMQGLRVRGSVAEVGRATTVSVVQSIFMVIVIDAAFSVLYNLLGY